MRFGPGTKRYCEISEANGASAPADTASIEAVKDIEHKVRQAKSAYTDPFERRAQRWFVESFLGSAFTLRRHEASDAVMRVFSLTHRRSRQLHDATLLAVRRKLIAEKRLPLVTTDKRQW